MANILIIDDDRLIRNTLARNSEDMGHKAIVAETLSEGIEKASWQPFDIVFLDVRLPDGNGLEALPKIRLLASHPEVIIITGAGDAEGAELAIRSGAWDYIQKPFSKKEIMLHLDQALEYRNKKSSKKATVSLKRNKIIGESSQISACLDLVAQCASSDINVLITGETGTGKELFARAIHENSAHCGNEFIVVDCTALPEQLVESLLFGHVKGAFTGADQAREGLIKLADGGTLFLDEVGELPMSIQKTFLRALQERRFRPVGGKQEIKSNFRLISATNRNLYQMVADVRFREDLLYRLCSFQINLPPLRDRKHDIKDLTQHYIYRLCGYHGFKIKGVLPEFMEILASHDWPGNVRELVNTLEKAILSDPDNPTLYPIHLPDSIRVKFAQSLVSKKQSTLKQYAAEENILQANKIFIPPDLLQPYPSLKILRELILDQVELQYLKRLMSDIGYDIDKAIKISGLSKARLYALLKKYNISRKKK
jgi:two-component system NtrC family response regulator